MEVMLYEINGEKMVLMDGSVWSISPGDTPTACTWSPCAMINIQEMNTNDMYSYKLTNLSNGVSVYAMESGNTPIPETFSDY